MVESDFISCFLKFQISVDKLRFAEFNTKKDLRLRFTCNYSAFLFGTTHLYGDSRTYPMAMLFILVWDCLLRLWPQGANLQIMLMLNLFIFVKLLFIVIEIIQS